MSSSIRDSLGFILPVMTGSEIAARQKSLSQTDKARAAKWQHKNIPIDMDVASIATSQAYHQLLFDSDLKGLCRGGIPTQLRPTMWFWLSGGYAMQVSAPEGLYNKLSSSTELVDDTTMMSVEEGISSLWSGFRTNTLFQTCKGSEALARIMYAALQYRADQQYSKALHQLAAFILVVMGARHEEQAFWTLVGLLNKLYPAVHGQVPCGSFIEQGVLELLVQKKMPRLAIHLANMGWELSAVTTGWISTTFTSHLLPEVVVRIWDAIFSEGSKVMHRVALALIKRHEAVMLGCAQLQVMRKILDMRLSRVADGDDLMHAVFHGVGSMPSALLSGFRQQVLSSAAFGRFSAMHAAAAALRLEHGSDMLPAIALLTPAAGVKGWLGRSMSRLSDSPQHGSMAGSVAGSSQACSDCGYASDAEVKDVALHKKRTCSGRPSVQFK